MAKFRQKRLIMLKTTLFSSLKSILSVITLTSFVHFTPTAFANDSLHGQHHGVTTPAAAPVNNTYSLGLNKTEILRLPAPASAVLVGNPQIADVSIHSADTVFVIGRSFGETNIVILDNNGNTLIDANIQVSNVLPRNGIRVYYGGSERETFNCTPHCSAAPILGDTPEFIGANSAIGDGAINNTLALGVPNSSVGSTGDGGVAGAQ